MSKFRSSIVNKPDGGSDTRPPAPEQSRPPYTPVALRENAVDKVRRGHPWVFQAGLEYRLQAQPGEPLLLTDARNNPLFVGLADPEGALALRVYGPADTVVDENFFRHALSLARDRRTSWGVLGNTDAWRWINGESDGLPGIVIDLYGAVAVVKLDAPYACWLDLLVTALRQTDSELKGILWRGEEARVLWGEVPESVEIQEYGVRMLVEPHTGQKTGLFLDQRENRHWVGRHAAGRRVLNLFSYTGGFSLAALAGGAQHVTSVDLAKPALATLERSLPLNAFDPASHRSAAEDAYEFLKRAMARGQTWDMVILDPPSLAHKKAAMDKAGKAYERLNRAAMQVLEPGGVFCTASCTSRMTSADFEGIVRKAAVAADRRFQIIRDAGAGADHPILLSFPEGRYLKFLGLQDY